MKEVKGYKCDYCGRFRVKAETIEKHEKECLANPNCRNCYMCKHAVIGGYEYDFNGCDSYNKKLPYCTYEESALSFLRSQGFTAETCEHYENSGETYENRIYDEAKGIVRSMPIMDLPDDF